MAGATGLKSATSGVTGLGITYFCMAADSQMLRKQQRVPSGCDALLWAVCTDFVRILHGTLVTMMMTNRSPKLCREI